MSLSWVCQQTLPEQTMAADALTADAASRPAPSATLARVLPTNFIVSSFNSSIAREPTENVGFRSRGNTWITWNQGRVALLRVQGAALRMTAAQIDVEHGAIDRSGIGDHA